MQPSTPEPDVGAWRKANAFQAATTVTKRLRVAGERWHANRRKVRDIADDYL